MHKRRDLTRDMRDLAIILGTIGGLSCLYGLADHFLPHLVATIVLVSAASVVGSFMIRIAGPRS